MKKVDFLPARYHENDVRRKATIWRYVLLLTFGGIICAATFGQLAIKHGVRSQLAALRGQHQSASGVKEAATVLDQELRQTEEVAELYTYLRHPWPRTQLLAYVTSPLPDSVVIHEIRIHQQDERADARGVAPALPAAKDEAQLSPAKRDLQGLRSANDSKPTVIQVSGSARDAVELNNYVAALSLSPLFKSAKLTSLEAANERQEEAVQGNERAKTSTSHFDVLITVLPGYGTPRGPTEPLVRINAGSTPAELTSIDFSAPKQLVAEVP